MINKIIASTFFVLLLFAISLSLMGVHEVSLGKPFMSFMATCSIDLSSIKFEIPDIPYVPLENLDDGGILEVIKYLGKIVNLLITLINMIIRLFNVIVQLLEFIFIVLRNLIVLRDTLVGG